MSSPSPPGRSATDRRSSSPIQRHRPRELAGKEGLRCNPRRPLDFPPPAGVNNPRRCNTGCGKTAGSRLLSPSLSFAQKGCYADADPHACWNNLSMHLAFVSRDKGGGEIIDSECHHAAPLGGHRDCIVTASGTGHRRPGFAWGHLARRGAGVGSDGRRTVLPSVQVQVPPAGSPSVPFCPRPALRIVTIKPAKP